MCLKHASLNKLFFGPIETLRAWRRLRGGGRISGWLRVGGRGGRSSRRLYVGGYGGRSSGWLCVRPGARGHGGCSSRWLGGRCWRR